ncbi:hypothetical protein [Photobacterium kishitanii]|uniref:Uncharacterized protein n=1 Tax=Photobacterium kishitanii TaxID=318456 RepID=A0A2T3KMK8_9GAMM|nr:hypothetical protein [Photobacterium kishitanii]PSV01037.1 hypothetical protein C9J27_03135 [Photobacterium kishitanii]
MIKYRMSKDVEESLNLIVSSINRRIGDLGHVEVFLDISNLHADKKPWDFSRVKLQFTPSQSADVDALLSLDPSYKGMLLLELNSYTAFDSVSTTLKITSNYSCITQRNIYAHAVTETLSTAPFASMISKAIYAARETHTQKVIFDKNINEARILSEICNSDAHLSIRNSGDGKLLISGKNLEGSIVSFNKENSQYSINLDGISFEKLRDVIKLLNS